jgi:hypothetical protein
MAIEESVGREVAEDCRLRRRPTSEENGAEVVLYEEEVCRPRYLCQLFILKSSLAGSSDLPFQRSIS